MPYFKGLAGLKAKHKATIHSIALHHYRQFKSVCTGEDETKTMLQIITEVSGIEVSKDFMGSAR